MTNHQQLQLSRFGGYLGNDDQADNRRLSTASNRLIQNQHQQLPTSQNSARSRQLAHHPSNNSSHRQHQHQHQHHNKNNMWQQDDHIIPAMNSADQPRLYSYASGSDGEGDGQRRNSASSSCSRSSCSCDDHPDDDRTREDYDENTVYASLKDEGMSSTLPLLSLNRLQQHQQPPPTQQRPAVPPRPGPGGQQQTMASAYAISDCMAGEDDGRGEGDFVPQFLVQTASGNLFVPSGTSSLPFPRTVPRRSLAPDAGSGQPLRTSQENMLMCTNGRLDIVRPDVRQPLGAQVPPIPPPPSSLDFCDYSTVKKPLNGHSRWRYAAFALVLLCVLLLGLVLYFAISRFQTAAFDPLYTNSGSAVDSLHTTTPSNALPPSLSYQLGTEAAADIAPESFWRLQMPLTEPKFLKCNVSVSEDGALGVFGRKNTPPTIVQYDFYEPLLGHTRSRRSAEVTPYSLFVRYFEAGTWYISIYNDNNFPQRITFTAQLNDKPPNNCPNACSGHGDCDNGQCRCFPGYMSWDCSQGVCPVLCNGNGVYRSGQCKCYSGWKGPECALQYDSCEDPTCSGNGRCVGGTCVCVAGYKGVRCNEVDCLMSNCSGNGVCIRDKCRCYAGYAGSDCSLAVSSLGNLTRACASNCSALHGILNPSTGECVCENGWTGVDCSREVCQMPCLHGTCHQQRCQCDHGWTGAYCDQLACDSRCAAHGYCNNGSCVCKQGWNGKQCTLEGCPNNCNNNGQCQMFLDEWRCSCRDGWKGNACQKAVEMLCGDGIDNDKDSLIDCQDSDCCVSVACKDNALCVASPDPMEILLRKQPPSMTASFYDRMKFLVEEASVQSGATLSSFNESQVSVIRGQVMTSDGSPVIGARLSVHQQPLYGATVSRELGYFDLLVNGGGSIRLQVQRLPFEPRQVTVMVPWNKIVVMETIVLYLKNERLPEPTTCADVTHDHYSLRPRIFSLWQHSQLGACPAVSTIIPESQVVQETIALPDSELYLMYHSSRSAGYMSTVFVQLTPDQLPHGLVIIHLRISIEGLLFEKTFEAEPNLKYKFAWDRRNAYNQKAYGIVSALVSAGYQYQQCATVFWTSQTTTLSGYDISSSDIGGWNLNIHHTYNFQEGILHKGDGTNIYLRERPKKFAVVLGNGKSRTADCRGCDGKAAGKSLLAPVALASGRDGSLYIGDFNHIRKLSPGREDISSILEMDFADQAHKYFMTVSPLDGKLYVSDYRSRRLLRVKTMGSVRDLKQNAEVIAGTGDHCVPGDREKCGDDTLATAARLSFPKGIAINKDGKLYFADGASIRSIGPDGIIRTEVGYYGQPINWMPLPCDGIVTAVETQLYWPTALAINPLDNSLHILDSNMVLRLTEDGRLMRVAGYPLHCPRKNHTTTSLLSEEEMGPKQATDVYLRSPQHIAFASNGDLYIVDSDRNDVNQILVVSSDGTLQNFAGAPAKCDCSSENCRCVESREELASKVLLYNPSAVTVTPDNIVHVADMGNLRLLSFLSVLPSADEFGNFRVPSPHTHEQYIFNRYGQHISTRHIITEQYVYNFTYDVPSYYGKLIRVTDGDGHVLRVTRDYMTQAKEVITPYGQHCKITIDNLGQLESFTMADDNGSVKFTYLGSTGLLESKETSGNSAYIYEYDDNGRVAGVVHPSGETAMVVSDVSGAGAVYDVRGGHPADSAAVITNRNELTMLHGTKKVKVVQLADGSMTLEYPFNMAIAMATSMHAPISVEHQMHISRRVVLPEGLAHRVEWRYYLRRAGDAAARARKSKATERIGRRLRVGSTAGARHDNPALLQQGLASFDGKHLLINGSTVIAVEYDRDSHSEYIYQADNEELLAIQYSEFGLPTIVAPSVPVLASLNVTYNERGQVTAWNIGDRTFSNVYESRTGLLSEKMLSSKATYQYIYKHSRKVSDVKLPTGKQYSLHYDSAGNVHTIVTPSSAKHKFHTWSMLAMTRRMYTPPGAHGAYKQDFLGNGRLKQVIYPSMQRQVTFTYNRDSWPHVVYFDWTAVTLTSFRTSDRLQSVNLTDQLANFTCDIVLGPDSAVYSFQNVTVRSGKIANLANASIRYRYDNHFRVISTETLIANRPLSIVNMTYDTQNGRMLTMKAFKFDYIRPTRDNCQDGNVGIMREYDAFGAPKDTWYKFNNYLVFNMETRYDAMGRVQQCRRKIGSSDLKVYEYIYDADGNLAEVMLGGSLQWKYEYDQDGNILRITQPNQVREFSTDLKGHIVSGSGGRVWTYDKDGFLLQRNQEHFEFNSRGQLMKAYQPSVYHVEYAYDGLDRLVMRRDVIGRSTTQFFYLDLANPRRLSHVYNHTSMQLDVLFYDGAGNLFSFERNGYYYYIASDPTRSPTVVFSSAGSVVKQLTYDPFGAITADTAAEFSLVFGYRSGIADAATKLVYIEGRFYDTETSRWISPDYAKVLDELNRVVEDPTMVNTYQYRQRLQGRSAPPTDLSNWFRLVGYDLSSLVPDVDFWGNLRGQQRLLIGDMDRRNMDQLTPTSAYQCAYERNVAEISKLSLVPSSGLVGLFDSVTSANLSPLQSMFGPGITLAQKNGYVNVEMLDSFNTDLLALATTLLNGSQLVSPQLTSHSHDVFYFVRSTYEEAASNIRELKLNDSSRVQGINVTIHKPSKEKLIDIRLTASHMVLNIRYGSSVHDEEKRVMRHARDKSVAEAWLMERDAVQRGSSSAYLWSPGEREELINSGSVAGWTSELVHSPRLAAQLAEHPRNVRFIKSTS